MTIQEQAEKLGVDADELLAFYRGLGPMPTPYDAREEEE